MTGITRILLFKTDFPRVLRFPVPQDKGNEGSGDEIGSEEVPRLQIKFLDLDASRMAACYYIGVDVGTASVRAALVASDGKIVSCATRPLQIWQPLPDYYEQSSEDVWRNVCLVVKVSKDLWIIANRDLILEK